MYDLTVNKCHSQQYTFQDDCALNTQATRWVITVQFGSKIHADEQYTSSINMKRWQWDLQLSMMSLKRKNSEQKLQFSPTTRSSLLCKTSYALLGIHSIPML